MSNEVLYRKWRPQSFAEVAGQEHVTRTLTNAVATGRVAHAYLFCGPRGTGKTTTGRILAKAVNCPDALGGEPCNRCPSCQEFAQGRAMDLVEMDAASNRGIDEIRKLKERVGLAVSDTRYRVYLVDEVHMLTTEANNALLKTLEEPPPHVIFILATTELHKVSATIISRCQHFDFRRVPLAAVVQRLSEICRGEGFACDDAALKVIARSASGSLRDAINVLEQLTSYYGPTLDLEQVQEALGLAPDARVRDLVACVLTADLPGGLRVIALAQDDGLDMRQLQRQTVSYLRNLLLISTGADAGSDIPPEEAVEMKALLSRASDRDILRALKAFAQADFRADPASSLPLELALAECVLAQASPPAAQPTPVGATPNPKPVMAAPVELPASEPEGKIVQLPTAAPAASATALGDDFLRQLRLACKNDDIRLAAYLNGSCQVESLEGDVLTLGFYPYCSLHKQKVEEQRRLVESRASAILGRPVTLVCVMTERKTQPAQPRGGHLLRAAREMGARPIINNSGGGKGHAATP